MKLFSKFIIISIFLLTAGCTSVLGVTGANEGKVVDDKWMVYNVIHPGLTITIMEPYSAQLMRLSTVSKSTPSPLKHSVVFGRKSKPHKFEIIGEYHKDLYLDGKYYGAVWYGDILIKDGVLFIDNVRAAPKNP